MYDIAKRSADKIEGTAIIFRNCQLHLTSIISSYSSDSLNDRFDMIYFFTNITMSLS